MIVKLFTDPHLGLNRRANVTPSSRQKLQDALYAQAWNVSEEGDFIVCLGDLLDKPFSSERIIRQAARITSRCDLVLAGNHDLIARQDSVTTLQLLSDTHPDTMVLPQFNKPCAENHIFGHVTLTAIPHVLTQELFDQSIEMAIQNGPTHIEGQTTVSVCILHCNYELGFAETSETSLNLDRGQAERLLDVYDYVVSGHEHTYRSLFDGRLIMLGNTLPVGFGEMCDKYVLILDDDGVRREKIWDAKEHYLQIDASRLAGYVLDDIQFLRITGDVTPEALTDLSKSVSKAWKAYDSLFAVKLDINLLSAAGTAREQETGTFKSLPEQVEAELAGTEMLEYWKEFTA